MDPVLAAQLARDLDRTLAALAHGERLLAGLDQAAAAIALQDGSRYCPLRTLLATAAASTERVQQALRGLTDADPTGLPAGRAVPDRSPGDGETLDPSPGLPPTTQPR
jgi:hypothetical protein